MEKTKNNLHAIFSGISNPCKEDLFQIAEILEETWLSEKQRSVEQGDAVSIEKCESVLNVIQLLKKDLSTVQPPLVWYKLEEAIQLHKQKKLNKPDLKKVHLDYKINGVSYHLSTRKWRTLYVEFIKNLMTHHPSVISVALLNSKSYGIYSSKEGVIAPVQINSIYLETNLSLESILKKMKQWRTLTGKAADFLIGL